MNVREKIKLLPHKPGVYQYFDSEGKIIYIGKAKNLFNRVSSYFSSKQQHGKTRMLVSKIADFQFIVVETELDALLLENNLIKKYQPRYNVLLKDDKTYPWICIKNERFPRVFSTRNPVKDGSLYFGPYANSGLMRTLLGLIRQLFPLRTCNYNLSEQNISQGKFRVCLDYQIGKCLGPCEGKQTEEDYTQRIKQIKDIIKGDLHLVLQFLEEKMQEYVHDLAFEKANEIKKNIEALGAYQAKSTVVSMSIHNVDVFSIVSDAKSAFINYLKVMNGAIIQSYTLELRKKLEESDEEMLLMGIVELRSKFRSQSKEILCSLPVSIQDEELNFSVPQRGDKRRLIELSEKNAKFYRMDKLKQEKVTDPDRHVNRILTQLQKDLRLPALPRHIECFDNSNIQGTNPVAACVVFKGAKPAKKDYRHFKIKTVEGPDDFASMEEVVFRRYSRLVGENQSLPQLIVIDGGKGQLSSALKALDKLNLRGKVSIIGIAKRLEEIYFPGDSLPLYIDKRSESLKIIQHLRNEAHRFGITFHRKIRSKSALSSELLEIPGIGKETSLKLYRRFKSVKQIKSASIQELEEVVSKSRAMTIYQYFNIDK